MEIKHENNNNGGSFAVDVDGEKLGELLFSASLGEITIFHTEVDPKLRGQHVGDKLVAAAVEYARAQGLKVRATCPFAKKVIDRTPEFNDVAAT